MRGSSSWKRWEKLEDLPWRVGNVGGLTIEKVGILESGRNYRSELTIIYQLSITIPICDGSTIVEVMLKSVFTIFVIRHGFLEKNI
jgi:hypothetical protein